MTNLGRATFFDEDLLNFESLFKENLRVNKNRIMKVSILLAIAITSLILTVEKSYSQNSDRWRWLDNSYGRSVYIDTETIKRSGNSYTVWTKYVCFSECEEGSRTLDYNMYQETFNCDYRTIQTLAGYTYYTDTSFREVTDYDGGSKPIIPDTVGETIFKYLCGE